MRRLTSKVDVLRALFARSGNQCAFPGCMQPLINCKNKVIAQVCHIDAAMEGGARFNPESDDEYRRSYENLLILCYPHHIETNDAGEYSVECLSQMKRTHEQLFLGSEFKIDGAVLAKLSEEMETYWFDIERLNKIDHMFSDTGLAMEVSGNNSFFDVIASANDAVNGIKVLLDSLHKSDEELKSDFELLLARKGISSKLFADIPYYEHPFENRNWASHNLGTPNLLQRLRIDLTHIEVKYLEEYLKTHSHDPAARDRFKTTKETLMKIAETAMHID